MADDNQYAEQSVIAMTPINEILPADKWWDKPSFREMEQRVKDRDELILILAVLLTVSFILNVVLLFEPAL
jgi:hypothetical protein